MVMATCPETLDGIIFIMIGYFQTYQPYIVNTIMI